MTGPGKVQNLDAAGLAALSICESLLISLTEKGVLQQDEVYLVLEDAVGSHCQAIREHRATTLHEAAARLIELIMANSNSVRGTSTLGSADPEEETESLDRSGWDD